MQEMLRAALLQRGYKIAMRPNELNVIGIRASMNRPNAFDDSLNVLFVDSSGRWVSYSWPATTDPGVYWLNAPMNSAGTAILKAGQYVNSHALGLHRQLYTALVQVGPVTVIRDFNKDSKVDYDSARTETGLFGINIHRAMADGTTKTIDKYSAGCQVFANAGDFGVFLQLAEKHRQLYGNRFTYTLLDNLPEENVPAFDSVGKLIVPSSIKKN